MKPYDQFLLLWLGVTSGVAFVLFGYDKFQAGRSRARVPEFQLALIGAFGGWLGGLLGMLVFRHKTASLAFKVKYAVSFVIWVALIDAAFAKR